MQRRDIVKLAAVVGLSTAAASSLFAQRPGSGADAYTARLSWVPISGAERADVAGKGSAGARIAGSRLSITGSFEGLPTAATAARLHQGVATGARGPAIADLTITPAAQGTLAGEVDLTAEQLAALRAGYVYVQIYAEKGVPEDNSVLWGWLLPTNR